MENNFTIDLKKLQLVENLVIPHQSFSFALQRLEVARSMARSGAEPRRFLLVGESGSGKTLLAKYFISLFQPVAEDGISTKPALYIETPAAPTLKAFAESLLVALGDPLAHRGSANEKRDRALKLIKKLKVEFIIVDEFQHFLDHGRGSLSTVADWFKLLIDNTNVPCLLLGLPRCEAILHANEQLRRRFSARLELPSFSLDTEDSELEFEDVLDAIDQQLPTDIRSDLGNEELARKIFYATNGRIGYVKKLLVSAFELMMAQGGKCIDTDILKRAFARDIWPDSGNKLNPFCVDFSPRSLCQFGEPFYIEIPHQRKIAEHAEVELCH